MDEATAAIDTHTDGLIQQTIRESFAHCTLLVVAHRLDTIAASDRVMVLDRGCVLEADAPAVLRQRRGSHFASLLRSAAAAQRT